MTILEGCLTFGEKRYLHEVFKICNQILIKTEFDIRAPVAEDGLKK